MTKRQCKDNITCLPTLKRTMAATVSMDTLIEATANIDVEGFVQSFTYQTLLQKVRKYFSHGKLIVIEGPKNFGKTTCLKLLSKEFERVKVIYVDIMVNPDHKASLNDIPDKPDVVLLLDNAQLYSPGALTDLGQYRFIVAAVSPSAGALATKPIKHLTNDMQTNWLPFYINPFYQSDIAALLALLGIQVSADVEEIPLTDPEIYKELCDKKKIFQLQLDRLMFITGGNPKYIRDFILVGDFTGMERDNYEQISKIVQLIRERGSLGEYSSKDSLCKSIIASFRGGCSQGLVLIGLAYMSHFDTKIYIANSQYLGIVMSLGYLQVFEEATSSFKNLETLVVFVLSAQIHDLPIPIITQVLHQRTEHDEIPQTGIVLVCLKTGHKAIDHLVVDTRASTLYMIQTSFQKYADRQVKRDAIDTMKIGGVSVAEHYKRLSGCKKVTYVYATYRPTRIQDQCVLILKLNSFQELLQNH